MLCCFRKSSNKVSDKEKKNTTTRATDAAAAVVRGDGSHHTFNSNIVNDEEPEGHVIISKSNSDNIVKLYNVSNNNDSTQQEIEITTLSFDYEHEDVHKSTVHTELSMMGAPEGTLVDPLNWGFPGYLTKEEVDVYNQFKMEVKKRSKEWRDSIFSFGYNEEEEYAYCRWLRARKFNLIDTIKMIDEATLLRKDPAAHGFYPKPEVALGVEEAIFKSQHPQIFAGYAKNSCPLFISKPGMINMNGLNCITTVENLHKYQWHAMIHGAGAEYRLRQSADPNFKRFQSVAILDLDGLGIGTVTGPVMDLIKHQSHVDSLCFPETMNKLVITNAPHTFSALWKVIRRWLDVRTANKIEIYSSKTKQEKRLKELIDIDQIPQEYGGTGPSIFTSILKKCNDTNTSRRVTKVITFKTHESTSFTLEQGEKMDVFVYTKAKGINVNFTVTSGEDKSKMILGNAQLLNQVADGSHEVSITKIAYDIKGPGKFKINGNVVRGSGDGLRQHYLVVGNISLQ